MRLAAAFNSNPPVVIKAGRTVSYRVTVSNIGSEVWYWAGRSRVELRVDFAGSGTKPVALGMRRVVAPGQSYTFTVKVTAPKKPGAYVLRHRLIKVPSSWFDTSQQVNVFVRR